MALNKLATDDARYLEFVGQVIEGSRSHPEVSQALVRFMTAPVHPWKMPHEFDSLEAYYKHLRRGRLRALSGDKVRSYKELNARGISPIS